MRWQELTWPRFGEAVKAVGGVCVVPVGAVLPYGGHLPLGTNYLSIETIAARAAEKEPAIVFPPFYFGGVARARFRRGAIALSHRVLLDLLSNMVSEIARNGLKKIVLLNGFWGNAAWLQDFTGAALHRERDYAVYLIAAEQYSPARDPGWQKMRASEGWSHGGETETSLMLAAYPDLVKMEEISGDGQSKKQMGYLEGVQASVQIYADHPDLYAGNARPATREKGEYVLNYAVERVAQAIAAVKADTKAAELLKKFYHEAAHPV